MVMLDGWPHVSVADLAPHRTDPAGLLQRLGGAPSGDIVIAPVSAAGAAELRVLPVPSPASEAAATLLASYLRRRSFAWDSADLVLIDRPCFLAVEPGVALLEDHRIVTETVFQWPHVSSIYGAFGGGFTPETLAAALARAGEARPGLWAPLLSRWGRVYGHALSEGLVQDFLFARLGLSDLVRYPVPSQPVGGQAVAAAEALASREGVAEPVIRVERLLFFTAFARHCRLGSDFRLFAEHTRGRAAANAAAASLGPRIYVSRQGAPARPMQNEAVLIEALRPLGFAVFAHAGQPLVQQAAAFADARLVVGPFGSGLTNAAFARPDAILAELRPLNTNDETPLWDGFFRDMSAVMGFAYCAHVSENPPRTDLWTADLEGILAMIRGVDPGRL
jgi:hypothetical protein